MQLRQRQRFLPRPAQPSSSGWRSELAQELNRRDALGGNIGSSLIQRVGPELACAALQGILEEEWAREQRLRVPKFLLYGVLGLALMFSCFFWPLGLYLLWQLRPSTPPSRRWHNAFQALRPFLADPQSPLTLEFRIQLWERGRHANQPQLCALLLDSITLQLQRLPAEAAASLSPQARRFLRQGLQEPRRKPAGSPLLFHTEFAIAALLVLSDTPPHPALDLPADLIQHLRLRYTDRRLYEAMEVYLDSRAGARR